MAELIQNFSKMKVKTEVEENALFIYLLWKLEIWHTESLSRDGLKYEITALYLTSVISYRGSKSAKIGEISGNYAYFELPYLLTQIVLS